MPVLSLSIGSNVDAANNIRQAVKALRDEFNNILCSTVYESEAVGFEGNNFLNLVAIIDTKKQLSSILRFVKQLEDRLGRDRTQPKFSDRCMDVDILTYGEATGAECGIVLPRPEITKNAFVLLPLSEVLPEQINDETGISNARMWQDYDKSLQKLWPIDFDWQQSLEETPD